MFALAKMLHLIKSGTNGCVARLYTMDEDILKKLTQSIYSEISYVAELSIEELLPFISGEILCSMKKDN